ncbi:MAG: methionine--tRNA ligase subunit beta, partial [Clostridia bacterium]|nr:methionine--tRNA ligase subunit beta [Clostridia bacterium]
DEQSEQIKKYWPCDVHIIGKDILRFHTIYWPILLMALDQPLPKQVFGHPWLLVGDGKMSKSKGNVIYADDLVDLFGVDAVRYYLLHEIPFASDGTMTYELLMERINSDLANILGNLVNRTIAMSHKYSKGILSDHAVSGEFDQELIDLCLATPAKVEAKMDELRVADAIDEIFALLRRANKYIDETMPWALAKDEAQHARLDTVLYNLLESIRVAATLLHPFLPETAERIFKQLNIEHPTWDSLNTFGALPAGHQLNQGEILFARIDIPKKLEEMQKAAEAKAAAEAAEANPPKAEIAFDDFLKVDMTVVKVLSCENVKKSEKLLKFQLDDGTGKPRQILSGIAKYYKAEELVGKTLVAVTNLAPRKMMGQESCGMLLSAEKDDKLNLIMLDDAIPAGAKLC